jgi:hypothetical protein
MMSFRPGNRGVVLVAHGYKYLKNKIVKPVTYWRCWREDCRAPIKTKQFISADEVPVFVDRVDRAAHNHPPDVESIERDGFRQTAIEAVKGNPSQPIKRTYNNLVLQSEAISVPQFHSIESSLKRAR